MNKRITYVIALMLSLNCLTAADKYKNGEILYVWAKNGLHVRLGPGTEYNILTALSFGQHITILEKITKTYNVTGLSETNSNPFEDVQPIVFKGNWVKILTDDGQIGYIIDHYILKYKPFLEPQDEDDLLKLEVLSIDSSVTDKMADYSTFSYSYAYDIQEIKSNSTGGYFNEFTIPNCTIEEAMVLLGVYDNYMVVSRNWETEVILSNNDQSISCYYTFKKVGPNVIASYGCSC